MATAEGSLSCCISPTPTHIRGKAKDREISAPARSLLYNNVYLYIALTIITHDVSLFYGLYATARSLTVSLSGPGAYLLLINP